MARANEDAHLLTDLALEVVHRELRPVYRLRELRTAGPGGRGRVFELGTESGVNNLAQAILMRLLTPEGELSRLGHPEYGSRVHELVGRENVASTRNLMKLFILDALKREPRVAKVVKLSVEPTKGARGSVDVLLRVTPVGRADVVQIGPFGIELTV
jgi:phage baseplate assembly protein W